MKNSPELKKTVFIAIDIIIIAIILFEIFYIYQYRAYTVSFNEKIETVMSKVIEKYPDITEQELIKILNNDNEIQNNVLQKYGIDLSKDSAVLQNDSYFMEFSLLNIVCLIILSILIVILFLKYNYSKDKKLKEITKYIEEINNKNYKLDIDDNQEGELSILKNEIYKTTIMLKEFAENSLHDKMLLKDSLSDISHQLRTPLTAMSVMLDNLIDNPDMEFNTRQEFIKDIRREIININFLVENLLKLSRLDANSVNFISKENYMIDIVKEAIKNISVLADLKNIEILTYGDKNVKINCDSKWQIEAITNILKNAIEHSEENSKIEIHFSQNKMYTKLDIKDYGKGISKEDLPHIFDRFYKSKNSSSESVGIGLALAKSIIQNSNGYISVESSLKKGSTFTIKYMK